jgi:hypothetical protein
MSKRSDLTGSNTNDLTHSNFKDYNSKRGRFTFVNQSSENFEEEDIELTSTSETPQLENPQQTNLTNFLNPTENTSFGNQSASNSSMSLNSNIPTSDESDL